MDRIDALIIGIILISTVIISSLIPRNIRYRKEIKELQIELHVTDSILFNMKRERAAGIILYNTYTVKSNLTLKQSKTLDSLMFALTDSSDIERIVKQYNLEGTIWQN